MAQHGIQTSGRNEGGRRVVLRLELHSSITAPWTGVVARTSGRLAAGRTTVRFTLSSPFSSASRSLVWVKRSHAFPLISSVPRSLVHLTNDVYTYRWPHVR